MWTELMSAIFTYQTYNKHFHESQLNQFKTFTNCNITHQGCPTCFALAGAGAQRGPRAGSASATATALRCHNGALADLFFRARVGYAWGIMVRTEGLTWSFMVQLVGMGCTCWGGNLLISIRHGRSSVPSWRVYALVFFTSHTMFEVFVHL